jgi:glycosyltransferase involved in cell wall biosynthesis
MKNLDGALEILAGVHTPVTLDIYGERGHPEYWRRCEHLMRALPDRIRATYRGTLAASEVHGALQGYDVMLLPTFDENYGHVIAEALAAGCPPLISDQTPWRDLEAKGVGWDLPLADPGAFRAVLEGVAAEAADTRAARSEASARWLVELDSDQARVEANARLFAL